MTLIISVMSFVPQKWTLQFHLHQRRAEGSDPFLWAEGVPGAKMHRMMLWNVLSRGSPECGVVCDETPQYSHG